MEFIADEVAWAELSEAKVKMHKKDFHFCLRNLRPEKVVAKWEVFGQKPRFLGQKKKKAGAKVLLVSQCPMEDVETEPHSFETEIVMKSRGGSPM